MKTSSFEVVSFRVLEDEVVAVVKVTSEGIEKSAFGGSAITKDAQGREMSLAADLNVAAERARIKAMSLFDGELEPNQRAPWMRRQLVTEPQPMPEDVAPSPSERVTSRQLSALYGASRRHDLGRDGLGRMIAERTGKHGAQFLTKAEASDLLDVLNGSNGTPSVR
jgi:hypothetical protein